MEEQQSRRSQIRDLSFEERLNVLYRHASQLGEAESIEEIAKHTLDAMEATIGVDNHDFYAVRGGLLHIVEARGVAPMGGRGLPLDGPGITVKAANTMRTMLVPDVREEPAYLETHGIGPGGERMMTLSELAVPVITDGKVVALLNTESTMLNALNEQDKELLETLAGQVASAISRLRYEESLKGLHQHASQLGGADSIEQVAEYTLDAMETTLGLEICDFAILQEDRLQSILERGRDRAILSRTQALKALHTRISILVPDTREEPAYVDAEIIGENGVKLENLSELTVPVIADGKAVAVLSVKSPRLNAFNEQDKELLETLANHVGFAISRLARAREVKERSETLEERVEQRTKELRDAQEQLVRQEKLAVLGQLAGGIGHELRNPLSAIKSAAYFLNIALEDTDPEVKRTLVILEKEVSRSERIINSLLDYARSKPPTKRKTDINQIVKESLSRTTIPDEVNVQSQLDEVLPSVLADPDQLVQVFGNIILNAVQAMPEGGRLTVTSESLSPESVKVSITDTGIGIPPENLGKIWDPLFTTKAKGIGLGLPIVKTIVEAHGGTIEVESTMDEGTTFTVKLPLDYAEGDMDE